MIGEVISFPSPEERRLLPIVKKWLRSNLDRFHLTDPRAADGLDSATPNTQLTDIGVTPEILRALEIDLQNAEAHVTLEEVENIRTMRDLIDFYRQYIERTETPE